MNPLLNTAFKAARRASQMMIRAAGNLDAVKTDSKHSTILSPMLTALPTSASLKPMSKTYPNDKTTPRRKRLKP